MALIRCPQCNTGHELDDALFLGGTRRVRCASCRTVWVAEPGKGSEPDAGWDIDYSKPPPGPESDLSNTPQGQGDIDALFDAPLKGAAQEPQSQGDIDQLFAEPPQSSVDAKPKSQDDIDSLFAESAKPEIAAPASEPIIVPLSVAAAKDPMEEAAERRSERRRKAAAEAPPKPLPPAKSSSKASFAVVFAAASIGTLATLLIFRHDVARLAPWSEGIYETIGLGTKDFGLFFEDIRSRVSREEGRETLEVTGTIHNRTGKRQMIPLLRLAVRNENGREVYVWTASADQADIGANDRVKFRRRLASPPIEGHSVEVRFVPEQDIVASVK